MIKPFALHVVTIVVAAICTVAAYANESPPMRLGLYVVVDNIETARRFYNQLFRVEPTVDIDNFISYRLAGGLFAIYGEEAYEHSLQRGNNVVPYLQVENIDREYQRVKRLSPKMVHDTVVDEGVIKLFMFTDPSGNLIEFFSLTQ